MAAQGDTQIKMVDKDGIEWGFAPMRDIAYFFPQLLAKMDKGVEEKDWEPWIADYLKFKGVTEDDVLRAYGAMCRFCYAAVDPDRLELKNPGETLEATGFFNTPTAAQLVVVTKLGQICLGAFWAGIKSATPLGKIPAVLSSLEQYGKEVELLLNSRWAKQNEQGPQMSGESGATPDPNSSSPSSS
jgi:hypothetical protein